MGRNGLREGKLKRKVKHYISHRAAQDQAADHALRANSVKKLIENRFKTDVRHAECVEKE